MQHLKLYEAKGNKVYLLYVTAEDQGFNDTELKTFLGVYDSKAKAEEAKWRYQASIEYGIKEDSGEIESDEYDINDWMTIEDYTINSRQFQDVTDEELADYRSKFDAHKFGI